MKTKVAIIGYGWVGKAMHKLFPEAVVFDPFLLPKTILNPKTGIMQSVGNKKLVNECDIVFICVPTPNEDKIYQSGEDSYGKPIFSKLNGQGKLDTSIVEECIKWCECDTIVVRSTVNPGDCDKWSSKYNKDIVFQPEYLGETPAHPLLDPKTRPFLILGSQIIGLGYVKNPIVKVIELYTTVYNSNITIRQVTLEEAEIIKLTENRAIAFKVAQCQELYDVCQQTNTNYYTIRDAVYGDDPRMNLWWTFVYPDNRGMNSKCIPKDVYAWCAWAESLGYEPKITHSILEKNKEWINKK